MLYVWPVRTILQLPARLADDVRDLGLSSTLWFPIAQAIPPGLDRITLRMSCPSQPPAAHEHSDHNGWLGSAPYCCSAFSLLMLILLVFESSHAFDERLEPLFHRVVLNMPESASVLRFAK